jgi:hypothetical protein
MREIKTKTAGSMACCKDGASGDSGCCNHLKGFSFLRFFVLIAAVTFVFVCGICVGIKMDYLKMGGGECGMMGYSGAGGEFGHNNMMVKFFDGKNLGYASAAVRTQDVRLFGAVTKVEGNMITITDNSAKEQVVLSQSNTIITATGTEVGLSAVKPGVNIVSVGAMNKDNQQLAKTIRIQ